MNLAEEGTSLGMSRGQWPQKPAVKGQWEVSGSPTVTLVIWAHGVCARLSSPSAVGMEAHRDAAASS